MKISSICLVGFGENSPSRMRACAPRVPAFALSSAASPLHPSIETVRKLAAVTECPQSILGHRFINKDGLDFETAHVATPAQEWDLVDNGRGHVEYPTKWWVTFLKAACPPPFFSTSLFQISFSGLPWKCINIRSRLGSESSVDMRFPLALEGYLSS